MRVLHTSDWHVGKAIRGRSRAGEHRAVLAEIAGVAEREDVDLVIVAGDLFDTAAPTPESERIVYRALLDLATGGRPVVVVAGNHDSAPRLAAVAPLSQASGITVASAIRPPGDGGVLEIAAGRETAQVALLPFPSQRYVVTADVLLAGDAADAHAAYADRVVNILRVLTAGFRADTVNLVAAHLMVMGGTMGGGERGAHTVFDYWVPATAFPAAAQYAALGHLHRAQQLPGPAPLHYCGSPLQLDFGETANEPAVNVVDVRPGKPAIVRSVPLTAGSRLRTLRGTLVDVLAAAAELPPPGLTDGGAGRRSRGRLTPAPGAVRGPTTCGSCSTRRRGPAWPTRSASASRPQSRWCLRRATSPTAGARPTPTGCAARRATCSPSTSPSTRSPTLGCCPCSTTWSSR